MYLLKFRPCFLLPKLLYGTDFKVDVPSHIQVKESDNVGLLAWKIGEVMFVYASQGGEKFERVVHKSEV